MEENRFWNRSEYYSGERIKALKKRVQRCKCKYCGGELVVRQLAFNHIEEARIEIFCSRCNRMEYGVEPEVYLAAKYFVEQSGFNCFPELEDNENTQRMIIAKVCEILTWQNRYIGILDDEEGYTIDIKPKENYIDGCVTFSENDFQRVD